MLSIITSLELRILGLLFMFPLVDPFQDFTLLISITLTKFFKLKAIKIVKMADLNPDLII